MAQEGATTDEIERAVRALTPAELRRLGKYAEYRLKLIRRAAQGHDYSDVLQHAIMLTLKGDRGWHKDKISLYGHLWGVIRSVTSHWAEKYVDEAGLESDLSQRTEEGQSKSPFDEIPAHGVDAYRMLCAKESVEAIERYFANDRIILLIINGLREGMTFPEIAAVFGVTQKDVEAGIRKMRRHLRNIGNEGKEHA